MGNNEKKEWKKGNLVISHVSAFITTMIKEW